MNRKRFVEQTESSEPASRQKAQNISKYYLLDTNSFEFSQLVAIETCSQKIVLL